VIVKVPTAPLPVGVAVTVTVPVPTNVAVPVVEFDVLIVSTFELFALQLDAKVEVKFKVEPAPPLV
jgi:hypothetical protein